MFITCIMTQKVKACLKKLFKRSGPVHYKTRIGSGTYAAGNDWSDLYFGLSCVIRWFQLFRVEGITCQVVINSTVS